MVALSTRIIVTLACLTSTVVVGPPRQLTMKPDTGAVPSGDVNSPA
jgi:hypothetical protein